MSTYVVALLIVVFAGSANFAFALCFPKQRLMWLTLLVIALNAFAAGTLTLRILLESGVVR